MDSKVAKLLSRVCAFYEEEGHAIMDCPFVPFHIRVGIVRHVELQNVARTLVDQSQDQEPRLFVIHNRLRGMELGGQLGPQSRHICPSIQFKNKTPKVYSHPHFAPQKIPMSNHIMGHRHIRINLNSPRMSEATIAKSQRHPLGTKVTKSHVIIITIRMEIVVAPSTNAIKGGVLY